MWELDYKEIWALNNWYFWTVVLEKTLESPLDCKEIQQVHAKGDQSWVFIGRTDVEAETPILWPPDVKNWLIGKDSDARKGWRREEKRMTEDEMVACIRGVCNFLDSVFLQQELKWWMDKCYSSVSLESKGKYSLDVWEHADPKDVKRREAPQPNFESSFYVFSPPPGPALCRLGYPGALFVRPEVLTLVLGPSFVLFHRLFPSLSFSHHHSRLLFPILTT